MVYSKLFSLLATFVGLVGALFLSKSVIILTPKIMLQLTSPYARCAYAPEQIASMAVQKSEAVIGVIFVIIAFTIQAFSILFASDTKKLFDSSWVSFWVVLALVSLITIGFSIYKSRIANQYQIETGKLAVQDYLNDRFHKIDSVNMTTLEQIALDLLKLKKEINETQIQFFKRVANYVNWEIPPECDLSKVEINNTKR